VLQVQRSSTNAAHATESKRQGERSEHVPDAVQEGSIGEL
jgi:hypothetical protein